LNNYSLKIQALYLFFGKIIAFLVVGIAPIILVRLISVKDFGIYRLILFVIMLLLPIISFRIPASLYYFYPRNKSDLNVLLSQTLALLLIVSCIGSIFFLILSNKFSILPIGVTSEYIFPIAIYLFIETLAQLIDHIFILDKKSKCVLYITIVNQVVRLLFIIGTVLFFHTVLAIVFALIIHSMLRLTIVMIYLVKKYKVKIWFYDKKLLWIQIKYIFPLALATIIWIIGGRFDSMIISKLMSLEDFAVYAVGGLGIMNAVSMLYTSQGNVCLPRFGELFIQNNLKGIKQLWHKMIVVNAAFTLPLILFCATMGDQIISILYTDTYISASNIWRINMLILLTQMLGYGYIPTAIGKTKSILLANTARCALVIPLSIFLVLKLGLIGGAISYVCGFWVESLIQLETTRKSIGSKMLNLLPFSKILHIFIISAVPLLFLIVLLQMELNNILTVLIGAVIYFPVVAIVLVFSKTIDIDKFIVLSGRSRIFDFLSYMRTLRHRVEGKCEK